MGSDRAKLISRCCYAAVTAIALSVMFWIAWCLFGLTAVQVSEAQRRAFVHYSPSTTSTTTTTTTIAPEETSSNSISKLPTTASLDDKRKHNSTADNHGGPEPAKPRRPEPDLKSSVIPGSQEDHVHARRVLSPGAENRPEEKVRRGPSKPTLDILPTRVYESDAESPQRDISRGPTDDIQSSRRSEPKVAYRDPEFGREESPRRRVVNSDRDRYGPDTDDRYSKGDTRVYPVREIYSEEDRDRKGDDDDDRHYDRRRYRDDRDDRYRDEERYRPKTDDRDDRYRDEERYRPKTDDKYLDRDDEKYRYRDEERYRYRDDERYRPRDDDRYAERDGERPRVPDDDGYRSRGDERYPSRVDDKYRPRDNDTVRPRDDDRYRPRDDDRYRPRDDDRHRPRDDDRHRPRDDDKYRPRDVERYKSREDEISRYTDEEKRRSRYDDDHAEEKKYHVREDDTYGIRDGDVYRSDSSDRRDSPRRISEDEDRYRPRSDLDPPVPVIRASRDKEAPSRSGATLPASSRYESSLRSEKTVSDYDIPARESSRSPGTPSNLPRPSYDDDEIGRRSRPRADDKYYDADSSLRRYTDDRDRHRTRLPDERPGDRGQEGVLGPRSSAAEYRRRESARRDDESYPRSDPIDHETYRSRRPADYDDDDRRPIRDDYHKYDDRRDRLPPRPVSRYPDDDTQPRRRHPDLDGERTEEYRGDTASRDEKRHADPKPPPRRRYGESPRSDAVVREKLFESVRPPSAKDVIEAASRQSDSSDQALRNVYYPVYDPRSSNLTSPEIIQQSERKGTTITERKRRSAVL